MTIVVTLDQQLQHYQIGTYISKVENVNGKVISSLALIIDVTPKQVLCEDCSNPDPYFNFWIPVSELKQWTKVIRSKEFANSTRNR